jgi:hypothetical protein
VKKLLLFIKRGQPVQRQRNRGFVLLTTLLGLLVFASLLIALQKLSTANSMALAQLADRIEEDIARASLYERLRGPVADAMSGQTETRVPLNGSEVLFEEAGRTWAVRVQDVEGLVDVYLSSSDLIGRVFPILRGFEANRTRALRELAPGERYPHLSSSLARFGVLDPSIMEFTTQLGQHGELRTANMPEELKGLVGNITPGIREMEQVTRVMLHLDLITP